MVTSACTQWIKGENYIDERPVLVIIDYALQSYVKFGL